MKYYIDTCIWIDYWENRSDNFRPLGEFAFNFFNKLNEEDSIYYSDLTIKELRTKYSNETINKIFSVIEISQILFLESNSDNYKLAELISKASLVHKSDALHIVLAIEVDAKFITRDKQILLSGLIKAHTPEELI